MPVIWRNSLRYSAATVALGLSGLCSQASLADSTPTNPPNFMMFFDASNDNVSFPDGAESDPAYQYNPADYGTVHWNSTSEGWQYIGQRVGSDSNGDPAWTLDWDCTVNEDPFVDAQINVTNNSAVTQTFWVYMPLPINPPVGPFSQMNGSVSAALSSQGFTDATLAAQTGDSVYAAFIDGNPVQTMWTDPYTLTALAGQSAGDSNNFSNQIGPGANAEIAIRLRFTLSAGDSATVQGIFDIQPIPAPAALPLVAAFGLLVGGRRRR